MIRVLDSAGSTLVEWGLQQHIDDEDGDDYDNDDCDIYDVDDDVHDEHYNNSYISNKQTLEIYGTMILWRKKKRA